MAKATRVIIDLPPASYAMLQLAAQENGINAPSAGSLILQAALARRVSNLVPKRPQPVRSGSGGKATAETPPAEPGRPAAADATPPLGSPEDAGAR